LSTLVIEQGTILDRIDYNIEDARQNVKKANVELNKTLKRESSCRARGCMGCLFTSILICTGLLVMKHLL
jgi:syntaxin 16